DLVGIARLPRREQQAPRPLDPADRGARLGVRAVVRQLVRIAERLALPAGSEAARHVLLLALHGVVLSLELREERVVARLDRDVDRARGEVDGAHGVALARRRPAPAPA